jgi:DNA phosphorothioation-dependent restriction protein DptG
MLKKKPKNQGLDMNPEINLSFLPKLTKYYDKEIIFLTDFNDYFLYSLILVDTVVVIAFLASVGITTSSSGVALG